MPEMETGYRPVPWSYTSDEWRERNLPKVEREEWEAAGLRCCPNAWQGWLCTRPAEHTGTCRAGTGRRGHVLAEWYSNGWHSGDTEKCTDGPVADPHLAAVVAVSAIRNVPIR